MSRKKAKSEPYRTPSNYIAARNIFAKINVAHKAAVGEVAKALGFGLFDYGTEVPLTLISGDETHARADIVAIGSTAKDLTFKVPTGYEMCDLKTLKPIGSFTIEKPIAPSTTAKRAIIEVKTGNAPLTCNQKIVYDAALTGNVMGRGPTAQDTMADTPGVVPVYVLRKP